jgi:hypothetical protein
MRERGCWQSHPSVSGHRRPAGPDGPWRDCRRLSRVTGTWPLVGVSNVAQAQNDMGCTVHRSGPRTHFSNFSKTEPSFQIMKATLLCSKIYHTWQSDRMKSEEELSFWKQVQIPNRIGIKTPRSKTGFEFELNLLGKQTCLEKSGKFPKILICLDLPKCEFRLSWLYGENLQFP